MQIILSICIKNKLKKKKKEYIYEVTIKSVMSPTYIQDTHDLPVCESEFSKQTDKSQLALTVLSHFNLQHTCFLVYSITLLME